MFSLRENNARAPELSTARNPTYPHPRYMRASPTRDSIVISHEHCADSTKKF